MYIARRLVRMAIEDIGLADPRALEQSIAAMQAVHFLGMPEGDLALGQLAIYLSVAPKSDASYQALNRVMETVEKRVAEPVPFHLRNAPTGAMKQWGYGAGYQHAHKLAGRPAGHGVPAGIPCRHKVLRTDQSRAGATHRGTSGRNPLPQASPIRIHRPSNLVSLLKGTIPFNAEYHSKLGRIRYRSTRAPTAIWECKKRKGNNSMLVPGANMSLDKEKDDRRGADRFPIEREVRYKILSRKSSTEGESGAGLTVNMSSNGVLFTTDRYLLPGRRLEVSISWPAQLNSKVALKLVARGRVVRSEEGRAAIEIHQYEFRTQASQGPTAVQ